MICIEVVNFRKFDSKEDPTGIVQCRVLMECQLLLFDNAIFADGGLS